jgi:poly(3-hydroxybutyrate) depolymerase
LISRSAAVATAAVALLLASQALAQKAEKRSIEFLGAERTFRLFVPELEDEAGPVPLLLLLHGSGRDGMSLIERWDKLAKREGFILAAPEALNPRVWQAPQDGPDFLYLIVEALRSELPIDPSRVYLFGHSAGASFSLQMAVAESTYFAAAAVHAGMIHPMSYPMADEAKRKIPLKIMVGTKDRFFPLDKVRGARDALSERDFPVELIEIEGHDHNYYGRAPKINEQSWEFLTQHRLEGEPEWVYYNFE